MAKLSTNKPEMRAKVVSMLLADRKSALESRNPSAAVSASTRIADLLLKADDEDRKDKPVNRVVSVIVHQIVCPVCREAQPVQMEDPEPHAEPELLKPKRKSGWDEE